MKGSLHIAVAAVFLLTTPGCSLILTKGPQTEVHPPPECTTSNAAPVADTVLASLSVLLLGFGVLGLSALAAGGVAEGCPVSGCNNSSLATAGWVSLSAAVVGLVMAPLFTVSAVNGYQRTSACRASLAPKAVPPPAPGVPTAFLLPASPVEGCPRADDAPRVLPLDSPAVRACP